MDGTSDIDGVPLGIIDGCEDGVVLGVTDGAVDREGLLLGLILGWVVIDGD